MAGVLGVGVALALAAILGAYAGRLSERRRIASGRSDSRGITPIANWEAELRQRRRAHLAHKTPESAARIFRLRIRR